MRRVDAEGGIVKGVAEGRVQAEVNRQAYDGERRVQSGQVKKVGVNCFEEKETARSVEFHAYRVDEAKAQQARLARIRRERDDANCRNALARVREAAAGGSNVMPFIMDAVEAWATVGEVCGALRDVFGTYREPVRF
jgi:methylmalonyl-CoA mutase N-terminal domain/subunit